MLVGVVLVVGVVALVGVVGEPTVTVCCGWPPSAGASPPPPAPARIRLS